jgi:hypothetical protein
MAHIGVDEACGGVQQGAPSVNVATLCHAPGRCIAPNADHAATCT